VNVSVFPVPKIHYIHDQDRMKIRIYPFEVSDIQLCTAKLNITESG